MNEKQTMERCYECIAKQCPKNNLNLCVKTEPVTAGADATVNVWFLGQIYVNKKPHIYRCIRSNRGRLGLHNTRVIRVKRRFRLFLGQC